MQTLNYLESFYLLNVLELKVKSINLSEDEVSKAILSWEVVYYEKEELKIQIYFANPL